MPATAATPAAPAPPRSLPIAQAVEIHAGDLLKQAVLERLAGSNQPTLPLPAATLQPPESEASRFPLPDAAVATPMPAKPPKQTLHRNFPMPVVDATADMPEDAERAGQPARLRGAPRAAAPPERNDTAAARDKELPQPVPAQAAHSPRQEPVMEQREGRGGQPHGQPAFHLCVDLPEIGPVEMHLAAPPGVLRVRVASRSAAFLERLGGEFGPLEEAARSSGRRLEIRLDLGDGNDVS
jgi:hypothetical protein